MEDVLTEDELRFLQRHGYAPKDVFDARPWSQAYWMEQIKTEGKWIALGSPCRKVGHRLRSRKGHCVQCDPKKLAFVERHNAEQWVYIARSSSAGLIKIGTCNDTSQRERQLGAERYGGAWDWRIVFQRWTKNAGLVEGRAQRVLQRYAVHRPYVKDGTPQTAIELLKCSTEVAEEVLDRLLNSQD